jgi:hypothetical protein
MIRTVPPRRGSLKTSTSRVFLVQEIAVALERPDEEGDRRLADILGPGIEELAPGDVAPTWQPRNPRVGSIAAQARGQIDLDGVELLARTGGLGATDPSLRLLVLEAPLEGGGPESQDGRVPLSVGGEHLPGNGPVPYVRRSSSSVASTVSPTASRLRTESLSSVSRVVSRYR